MSNRPQMPPLDQFMRKLAAVVRESPELAPLAYARGAEHVRSLISRPESKGRKLQLQLIANQLDLLAAQAVVPEADPIDAEIISPYSDDPNGQFPTEFDGVVADFAAAKVDGEGNPTDDLTQGALFERFKKERERENVTPVQITPESAAFGGNKLSDTVLVQFGGTSGSGSFTGSGGVAGPVVAEQETQVIRWDGRESEALPCVISLSRLEGGANATFPTANNGSATYSYRPFARINWGSGERGRANEAWVDVGAGQQITVSGNHVYVNVGMSSFTATVDIGDGVKNYVAGSMYLSGHLGFYKGASQAPVTKTEYIDQLDEGSTAFVTIPNFAKSLLPPQCTRIGSAQTTLTFFDINLNMIYRLNYINGTIVTPIPLSNDAYYVRVQNVSGSGGAAAYRLVFQLSL